MQSILGLYTNFVLSLPTSSQYAEAPCDATLLCIPFSTLYNAFHPRSMRGALLYIRVHWRCSHAWY